MANIFANAKTSTATKQIIFFIKSSVCVMSNKFWHLIFHTIFFHSPDDEQSIIAKSQLAKKTLEPSPIKNHKQHKSNHLLNGRFPILLRYKKTNHTIHSKAETFYQHTNFLFHKIILTCYALLKSPSNAHSSSNRKSASIVIGNL